LFLERFSDFFNGEILDKKKYIRELSRGNQKKIGIAAALMGEPDIVVLDEPFPHLDPSTVIRLKEILLDLNKNHNKTLLISSHDLNHVTEICDRIVLLEQGRILKDKPCDDNTLGELKDYFSTIKI
jgi:ABC-2 type transport system ATP-binding protein